MSSSTYECVCTIVCNDRRMHVYVVLNIRMSIFTWLFFYCGKRARLDVRIVQYTTCDDTAPRRAS